MRGSIPRPARLFGGTNLHVHDSALQALIVFAMVIVIGTGYRILAARLHDSALGKAMAFTY